MTAAAPLTLPTVLTLLRLASAPLIAAGLAWAAAEPSRASLATAGSLTLFVLAAATDWLDGYLARKLDQKTVIGAALDHAADKAVVTAALVVLAGTGLPLDMTVAAALILSRDVAVAGLREGLALSGRALPVVGLGKVKTVFELVGVGGLIAARLPGADRLMVIAQTCVWAATGLALWSGALYLRSAFVAR